MMTEKAIIVIESTTNKNILTTKVTLHLNIGRIPEISSGPIIHLKDTINNDGLNYQIIILSKVLGPFHQRFRLLILSIMTVCHLLMYHLNRMTNSHRREHCRFEKGIATLVINVMIIAHTHSIIFRSRDVRYHQVAVEVVAATFFNHFRVPWDPHFVQNEPRFHLTHRHTNVNIRTNRINLLIPEVISIIAMIITSAIGIKERGMFLHLSIIHVPDQVDRTISLFALGGALVLESVPFHP